MQQSIDLHPCFPSERQQCGQSYYESEFDADILGMKQLWKSSKLKFFKNRFSKDKSVDL